MNSAALGPGCAECGLSPAAHADTAMDHAFRSPALLPDGTYVLSRDIENPDPKEQSVAFRRAPIWKKGTVFMSVSKTRSLHAPEKYMSTFYRSESAYGLIADALVAVVETPSQWMTRQQGAAGASIMKARTLATRTLDYLVATGVVSMEEVQVAYAASAPRVPCPVCSDGSCMLCDDNGCVPEETHQ